MGARGDPERETFNIQHSTLNSQLRTWGSAQPPCPDGGWMIVAGNSFGAKETRLQPLEKTSLFRTLGDWFCPLLYRAFWRSLWTSVIVHNQKNWLLYMSRTTNLVFLLDAPSYYTWPHPRSPLDPNIGSILSHVILSLRNPFLKAREVPGQSSRTSEEGFAEFQRDLAWRNRMFQTYGDKWPKQALRRYVLPRAEPGNAGKTESAQ